MANDPLGLSFSPFSDNKNPNAQAGGAPTPQEAIRVLSFRPPRTVGAFSPVPGPLLNAGGGSVFGGSGLNLEALLQMLFGQRKIGTPGVPVAIAPPPMDGTIRGTFPPMQPGEPPMQPGEPPTAPPSGPAPAPKWWIGDQPGGRTSPNPWELQQPPDIGIVPSVERGGSGKRQA